MAGHRAQGLKLIEEGGNPDPLLGQAEAGPCRDADRARGRRSRCRGPEAGRGQVDGAGGPGHDRQGPEGPGVLRARPAGPRTRNRAASHGLDAGRVVSKRPRAGVCPIVVASGGAQPRPGSIAAGDLRPAGRAGRGGRDHDETGISQGGRARRRAGPAAADRAPVDVGPGRAAECPGQCPQRVPHAQRRPGRARAAGGALDPSERGDRERRRTQQPRIGAAGQGGDHRAFRRAGPRLARAAAEPEGSDRRPVDRPVAGRGRHQELTRPSRRNSSRSATRPVASTPF